MVKYCGCSTSHVVGKKFTTIALVWRKLKEFENLTISRDQIHIRRACVLTEMQETIYEVINFTVDGEVFRVRVMEDLI